jgi:hypothetical protein
MRDNKINEKNSKTHIIWEDAIHSIRPPLLEVEVKRWTNPTHEIKKTNSVALSPQANYTD